jgi:hypothetical protein
MTEARKLKIKAAKQALQQMLDAGHSYQYALRAVAKKHGFSARELDRWID